MTETIYAAFIGQELAARGRLAELIRRLHPTAAALQGELRIFDEGTGRAVDFDWRGDAAVVENRALAQVSAQVSTKPRGRPKLGVESREITLLPRHWAWLEAQGGVSATLRRLIDGQPQAAGGAAPNIDAIYRLASALGGDFPQFEEAARSLYRGQWRDAQRIFRTWPEDIGVYLAERLTAIVATGASKRNGDAAADDERLTIPE